MDNIIYVITNNETKDFEYNIDKDTIIYHFSINSSCNVKINMIKEGVNCNYYHNNINYDDNSFKILINHVVGNNHSELYNHGVNVNNNKLAYYVDGYIPEESYKCICNQENQIININDGKSSICPNQIIHNFDVESEHSAYIGKFSDDLMFYMMSRGISRDVAYKLLLNGFLINTDSIERDKIKLFIDEIEKI